MSLALKIRQYIIYPLLLLTILFTPDAVSTDSAKLIDTDTFIMDNASVMGQGITTDGEYYYTSGTLTAVDFTAIAKYTVDGMEFVDKKINPLPEVCKKRGNNHIGGISYYDGKIYASVEGDDGVPACIVTFDTETLDALEVYDLSLEQFPDGVPWCAVDGNTGYLYASKWKDTKTIYVYDVNNDMAFVKALTLDKAIKRIQGGEFLDGTLYLSKDSHDKGKIREILSVNVETGAVEVVAERNIGSEKFEAEGMTFTEDENGAVLHVLDYNKTIGIFVHHYEADF
ncbi:MAG: hypothetical protein IJ349_02545 [Clostridia bacterium]|nr:hypothetical protein [Clostridia bacterium]